MGNLYKFLVIVPILLITILSPIFVDISQLTIVSCIIFYILSYLFAFNLAHRGIVHKQFNLTRIGENIVGFIFLFALRGDILGWTLSHRYHHRYSDTEKDYFGPANGVIRCFMGWIYSLDNIMLKYRSLIKDYQEDDYKFFYFLYRNKTYIIWGTILTISLISIDVALGLIISSGLIFIIEQTSNSILEHDPIKKRPYNNYIWAWFSLADYHKNHHDHPWKTSDTDPGKFLKPLCKFLRLAK
jgi:stearoyl-CoA desaturase (delta-9 desaturase)